MSWALERMRIIEEAREATKSINCNYIHSDGLCCNDKVQSEHCLLVWTESRVCSKFEDTGKKHENS